MFEWILNFLIQALLSLLWGLILLLVALFVLPEKIFLGVIKIFKKDLVSKSQILNKVRIILDYIFNLKEVIISDLNQVESFSLEKDIKELFAEKRKLEGNLFFLDLLKGYSNMLLFSVLNSGYDINSAFMIMGQSLEYLQYYSRELKPTNSMMDQGERIQEAAYKLEAIINSIEGTNNFSDDLNLKKIKSTLKKGTEEFDSFIKLEYDKTKKQLILNNQKLADKLLKIIN